VREESQHSNRPLDIATIQGLQVPPEGASARLSSSYAKVAVFADGPLGEGAQGIE